MEQEIEVVKENIEQEVTIDKENIIVGTIPTGNIDIAENGVYNVSSYESASVSVVPSGSIYITENGQYNVTDSATASVNVTSDYNCKVSEIVNSTFYNNITKIDAIKNTTLTNLSSLFSNMASLEEIVSIDLTDATNISSMFQGCIKLKKLPTMNTSNITNMRYLFQGCYVLENIPVYDTSNVGDMRNMYTNCTSLSDESLNNILQMCINATHYGRTKTLVSLGIESTNYSASRIQSLSKYQDFINAGWSIGY